MPKQQRPKIRVTNMSEKQTVEIIIASIINQNEWLKDAEMKVLHVFDVKHTESRSGPKNIQATDEREKR